MCDVRQTLAAAMIPQIIQERNVQSVVLLLILLFQCSFWSVLSAYIPQYQKTSFFATKPLQPAVISVLQSTSPSSSFFSEASSSSSSSGTTANTATAADVVPGLSALRQLVEGNIPWNALVGEADRAFRLGVQLDQNGQSRKASAAFHEAATLYQCKLDYSLLVNSKRKEKNDNTDNIYNNKIEGDDPEDQYINDFGHVTALQSIEDVRAVLSYVCLALGYLNWDVLQNPMAGHRLFHRALQIDASTTHSSTTTTTTTKEDVVTHTTSYTWDGIGFTWEASTAGRQLPQAIAAYRKALAYPSPTFDQACKIKLHLAIALERWGQLQNQQKEKNESADNNEKSENTMSSQQEAEQLLEELSREEAVHSCWVDSWGYVRWHTRKVPVMQLNLYRGSRDMLELAIQAAMPLLYHYHYNKNNTDNFNDSDNNDNSKLANQFVPLVCEFGVGNGRSLRLVQEIVPLGQNIHCFTGLLQDSPWEPTGSHSTGGTVPNIMDGISNCVVFHRGYFRDTIAPFLKDQSSDSFLACANIDSRLYSSTRDVLEALHGRVWPGTILVFHEYFGHPGWRHGVFRAWRECCKRFGWKYDYLAFSLATRQVVVRVTDA